MLESRRYRPHRRNCKKGNWRPAMEGWYDPVPSSGDTRHRERVQLGEVGLHHGCTIDDDRTRIS